jgi:hypothetical protein
VEEAEVRYRRFGPILATVFGDLPDVTLMNMVQGAAEAEAVEEGHLAEAIEWVRSREVDYLVAVTDDRPGTECAEDWLETRGYERGARVRRFLHPGTERRPAEPSRLQIRELAPLETEGMSHIFGNALGLSALATVLMLGLPARDGWHCYGASLEGREVACGSMLVFGKVALLGLDATVPGARGHGAQTALLTRRLVDATTNGCDVVVAEVCDEHGVRAAAASNLKRVGFEEIPGSINWQRPRARSPLPFLNR